MSVSWDLHADNNEDDFYSTMMLRDMKFDEDEKCMHHGPMISACAKRG